jgi:hypothetical protein
MTRLRRFFCAGNLDVPIEFHTLPQDVTIRKYCSSRPGIHRLTWADAPGGHTISEYLPQDRHFAFATERLVLAVARDIGIAPGGSGLIITRCSTARIAVRLRSVFHDSHALRTRSDGGISLMTGVHSRGLSATRRHAPVVEPLVQVEHAFGSCLMGLWQAASRVAWSRGCGL